MTKAEAEAAVKKYGSQTKAAAALKMGRATIKRALESAEAKEVKKPAGRSLTDFRKAYDKDTIIPSKIKAGLTELGQSWEYESEFVKRCGISFNDMGNYRDQFEGNWMVIRGDGKKVWSSVKLIEEMKGMV